MKIQSINYDITRKHRLKQDYGQVNPRMKERSAGLCDENNKSNIAFCSGSQSESVAAANTFMGKVLKSGWFNSLARFSGAHNIASSALISLFLAGLLRPAATVALPGKKDKDDKLYAAGHSMASGIIGFIFSTIITSPLDSGSAYMLKDGKKMSKTDFAKLSETEIKKLLKDKCSMSDEEIAKCLKENKAKGKLTRTFNKGMSIITSKTDKINELKAKLKATADASEKKQLGEQIRELENHIKGIDTTMHNVVDWGIAIPRATLTIALIPVILKYIFRLENKSKTQPQTEVKAVVPATAQKTEKLNHISMEDFAGGRK